MSKYKKVTIYFCLILCIAAGGCQPVDEEPEDSDTWPECEEGETPQLEWCETATRVVSAKSCACGEDEKSCEAHTGDTHWWTAICRSDWEYLLPSCIPVAGPTRTATNECLDWLTAMTCEDLDEWWSGCDFT